MDYRKIFFTFLISLAICGCSDNPYGPTGHIPSGKEPGSDEPVASGEYAKGADISWLTEMEKDGQKFYTSEGREMECTALMKELGFNSIRLRVWVNPDGGWCAMEDVLVKARKAKEAGMRIMIDFHYSDSWADPSKQNIPAAWKDYDVTEMTAAVKSHTSEVLQLLKHNGIEVEWVQIGNEVNSGMLWPSGKVEGKQAGNFISYVNAGYASVKDIYPSAKVIIHVSNGHDKGLFEWFFDLMKLGNARYDIIGMSLYPSWWENNGWRDWKVNTDICLDNIRSLSSRYGKPVMICEFGMPVSQETMSREAVEYLFGETRKIESCHGIFYWEPQTDGVWKPSNYAALGWGAYNMGAFRNGKATSALEPFRN
jgi:arabinogalactan endo-1,4-beta-galactosidase